MLAPGLCCRAISNIISMLSVAAGTYIKQESSATMPDDGVPMQAAKQGTSLLDALNGDDGGNTCLLACILTCSVLAIGSSSSIDSMQLDCAESAIHANS